MPRRKRRRIRFGQPSPELRRQVANLVARVMNEARSGNCRRAEYTMSVISTGRHLPISRATEDALDSIIARCYQERGFRG